MSLNRIKQQQPLSVSSCCYCALNEQPGSNSMGCEVCEVCFRYAAPQAGGLHQVSRTSWKMHALMCKYKPLGKLAGSHARQGQQGQRQFICRFAIGSQLQLQVAELICRLTATQGTSFLGKLRGRWVFVCYSAAEVGCTPDQHLLMCHAAIYLFCTLHRLCMVLEQAARSMNTALACANTCCLTAAD